MPNRHTEISPVGRLLRDWRASRGMSQLDLALEAGVSARHLSFVETGRSRPSRELLLRLSDALSVPLRARNDLAQAAGFAAPYRESRLDDRALDRARQALNLILAQQEPYPAFVIDRHWNAVMANQAMDRLLRLLLGPPEAEDGAATRPLNVVRLILDPAMLRPYVVDWENVARMLMARVRHEAAARGPDAGTAALIEDLLSYPGVPRAWVAPDRAGEYPFLALTLEKDNRRLSWFSTVTTFGTAQDVTLQELVIEALFPADDETAELAAALAETRRSGA